MSDLDLESQTQAPTLVGVALGFIIATTVVLTLRMYTRLFMLRMAGADDWSILVAMGFAVVVSIGTCFEARHGMGRHVQFVSEEDTGKQLKWLYVCILHYNMGMNVVKLSFLFQFRRIFESTRVQQICFWSMIYVGLWACVQITLLGISCLPIQYIVPSTGEWCLDTLPVWYFSSAMSLATDLLIFSIPLPSVIKLKLPLKQKIMVVLIFCLGFFVCIISVYRMCTLRDAVESDNPPWDNVGAAIWSVIELNCAIICASLPTLRPLVAKVVPGMSSNHSNRATYERYGSKYAAGSQSRIRARPTFLDSKHSPQSMSTEELALHDIAPAGHGSAPTVYVEAGGRDLSYGSRHNSKSIMVTTETSVQKH